MTTKQYDFTTEKVTRWTPTIKKSFIDFCEKQPCKAGLLYFQGITTEEYSSWLHSLKKHGTSGLQTTRIGHRRKKAGV